MSVNVSTDNEKEQTEVVLVVEEEPEVAVVGVHVGQCKWFNDLRGYGFVTVCDGSEKGKDIFVHHSGIKPLNTNYKTLKKGEYLNFNIVQGINGLQAVDVTGINGGPLMCDFVNTTRPIPGEPYPSQQQRPSRFPVVRPTSEGRQLPVPVNGHRQTVYPTMPPQWYVVTKTGRKKNLAKYSKEGRTAMKQYKQTDSTSSSSS